MRNRKWIVVFVFVAVLGIWFAVGLGSTMEEPSPEDGESTARRAIACDPLQPVHHVYLAACLSQLGRTDAAFGSLARAVELGYTDVHSLKTNTLLAGLRRDAKFDPVVLGAQQNAESMDLPDKPYPLRVHDLPAGR